MKSYLLKIFIDELNSQRKQTDFSFHKIHTHTCMANKRIITKTKDKKREKLVYTENKKKKKRQDFPIAL
jgi:hypothetical protein